MITFTEVTYIMKQVKHSCIKSLIGNPRLNVCIDVRKYMQNVAIQNMDFNSNWLSVKILIKKT